MIGLYAYSGTESNLFIPRLTVSNIQLNKMEKNMRIGFIGAGRVGTSLGKYLSENGLSVSGFYSRTQSSAEESAEFIGGSASAYSGIKEIITDSDLIFITVNDGAIADVSII